MTRYAKICGSGIGIIVLGAAVVWALESPAAAQSRRPEPVQKLVDELRGMVERGEQRRLAVQVRRTRACKPHRKHGTGPPASCRVVMECAAHRSPPGPR